MKSGLMKRKDQEDAGEIDLTPMLLSLIHI